MTRRITLMLDIGSADERRCGAIVRAEGMGVLDGCRCLSYFRRHCSLFGALQIEDKQTEGYYIPLRHERCRAAEVKEQP